MGILNGNGKTVLQKTVGSHIDKIKKTESPKNCDKFTTAVRDSIILSLQMGEASLKNSRIIITLLVVLIVVMTKVDNVGILELLFKIAAK